MLRGALCYNKWNIDLRRRTAMAENLRSLDKQDMEALMLQLGEPKFRAKQLFGWVHGKGVESLAEMHNLGKNLLAKLEQEITLPPYEVLARQQSVDGTEKFLLALEDGQAIECVLMRYRGDNSKHRNTLCVSSQVGCAMGCTFCATGQGGFVRNLSVGEILGQVYAVNRYLQDESDERIGNIVFMGMGEPLLNFDNVLKAINIFNDEEGLQIGIRRMTISTCGIAPQIERLAEQEKEIVFAVSLHAPNDEQRSEMMPVNKRYPLAVLMKACRHYQKVTGKRISFEYALMKGFNDSDKHIQQLQQLLQGMDAHINLIPVNPVDDGSPYRRPSRREVLDFAGKLKARGLACSVREEKGTDIDGACGQLRGKVQQKKREGQA